MDILALLQCLAPCITVTTLRQLYHVITAMLSISGRITMLGLSRWSAKGGSYRTIQRLYHTVLPWEALQWRFFQQHLLQPTDEYIIAGDEVVVSKAGTETYGLDHFFAGLQQQVIPGLAFFAFSVVNVREERSYPLQVTQVVKSAVEKAARTAPAAAKKSPPPPEKRTPGRPKGSQNKAKQAVVLNAELVRIQKALHTLLATIGSALSLKYVALDGHFGNYPSAFMVRATNLHLISKLRCNAALYPAFVGEHNGPGAKPKYGAKINMRQMDAQYLKETATVDQIRTDIYQGQFYNKEFAFALNVVIMLKTNLTTQAQAHVILFSTDLELAYAKLIQFYSLRFQIEFNFRDAKQYWGGENFMNVKETAVTNAANLSLFMVNFSTALLPPFRRTQPDYSILDLKAQYRGYRYAHEIIKMLPEKPEAILLTTIFERIARLGAIHPLLPPPAEP
jgi:putative transposase